MGNYFTSSMQENMKKNQELMQQMNKIKMEKQMQFQAQMQKRQMAMQIAGNREFCNWLSTFYVTAAASLFAGFRKSKKPVFLAPLFPLTFVELYYLDLAHGNKLQRIRREAEYIMTHETDLLQFPSNPPAPPANLSLSGVEEKKRD